MNDDMKYFDKIASIIIKSLNNSICKENNFEKKIIGENVLILNGENVMFKFVDSSILVSFCIGCLPDISALIMSKLIKICSIFKDLEIVLLENFEIDENFDICYGNDALGIFHNKLKTKLISDIKFEIFQDRLQDMLIDTDPDFLHQA